MVALHKNSCTFVLRVYPEFYNRREPVICMEQWGNGVKPLYPNRLLGIDQGKIVSRSFRVK